LTEPSAGALSGDRHLKNKGRVEEAKGSAKKTVDKVADTLTGRKSPEDLDMREPTQPRLGR
jgi:uncharacterized protein YjbJ (UPF0337 family)